MTMETTLTTARGEMTIRPAREADALAFRDLRLEALRDHPTAYTSDYASNREKPTSYWTERLRFHRGDNTEMIYFATQGNQLVGMSGIYGQNSPKVQHSMVIWGVYVRPDWRGLHLAENLIAACIAWARPQSVKIVKLAVVTTNTAAIRCYARSGFQVYGIEPQALYYDNVFYDELLMAKTI